VATGFNEFSASTSSAAHSDSINALAISPDGRHIYTASTDTNVFKVDTITMDKVDSTGTGTAGEFTLHTGDVRALALSPDGAFLYSGEVGTGTDNKIYKIKTDGMTGEQENVHFVNAEGVLALAITPDGRYLFSGSSTGVVRKIDTETMTQEGEDNIDHTSAISSIVVAPRVEGPEDLAIHPVILAL